MQNAKDAGGKVRLKSPDVQISVHSFVPINKPKCCLYQISDAQFRKEPKIKLKKEQSLSWHTSDGE